MKMLKKVIGVSLLLPLMGFAASEKISEWGFEPNGDVRVVVGDEAVFVSPADEASYFQTLMAARMQWPVEVVSGHVVVDASVIPPSEVGVMTACSGPSCAFSGVSHKVYTCLLAGMEKMILSPPPPATGAGTITSWPQVGPNDTSNVGVVTFTMPPFIGPFSINVNWAEPNLNGVITAKPTKPVTIPDTVIWGYVETQLEWCKKQP